MSKLFVACIAIFFVGFAVADPGWRTANTMHALSGVVKVKPKAKPDMFAFNANEDSAKEKLDNQLNQAYAKMQDKPVDPTAHLSEQVRVGIRHFKGKHGEPVYSDSEWQRQPLGIGAH